jgi:hypothetical protein
MHVYVCVYVCVVFFRPGRGKSETLGESERGVGRRATLFAMAQVFSRIKTSRSGFSLAGIFSSGWSFPGRRGHFRVMAVNARYKSCESKSLSYTQTIHFGIHLRQMNQFIRSRRNPSMADDTHPLSINLFSWFTIWNFLLYCSLFWLQFLKRTMNSLKKQKKQRKNSKKRLSIDQYGWILVTRILPVLGRIRSIWFNISCL